MTLEEGHGDPTPPLSAARGISPTAPRAPSPSVTPGHTTTPKEGTGDILHLETSVGTASDEYGLLTATSLNYICPNNR